MSLVLLHCQETKEEYLLQNLFRHSSLIVRSEVLLKPCEPECIGFLGRCSNSNTLSDFTWNTNLAFCTPPPHGQGNSFNTWPTYHCTFQIL